MGESVALPLAKHVLSIVEGDGFGGGVLGLGLGNLLFADMDLVWMSEELADFKFSVVIVHFNIGTAAAITIATMTAHMLLRCWLIVLVCPYCCDTYILCHGSNVNYDYEWDLLSVTVILSELAFVNDVVDLFANTGNAAFRVYLALDV